MGTAQRRLREAEGRRQAILDAARKVFWTHGFDAATMPQIAGEAELAPGTLYLYFPSKTALYVELLFEGYRRFEERLSSVVASEGRPRDRAEALIDGFFGFARENPEYFNIIFFLLQKEGRGGWTARFPAEQVKGLDSRMAACKAIAARVLSQVHPGRTSKEIERIVDAVWSMLSGVLFYFKEDSKFRSVAREAKRLVLQGLFPGSK